MKGWSRLVGALVFVFVAAGCTTNVATQLTVLAASSLTSSLPDLEAAWSKAHPETRLVTSTGATSALRTQIEQGAPADILLGADTSNAQALIDEDDAWGPLTEYATNQLIVIVPADNPAAITSPADLAKPGICVIAAGPDVPITKYAAQLVDNLTRRPEYGADFAARYSANVCSQEDNVGAVVSKVSLGEGDAAIVYVTDARSGQNLETIDVPADSNVVATYGAVATRSSPNGFTNAQFLNWLLGDTAQAVFAAHGFGAAP